MINENVTESNKNITRFDTSNCDPVWKAIFDDRLDKTAIRIMAIMLSRQGKHLFSCRSIGVMVGVSHVAASTSLKKLVDYCYLVKKGADYYLNLKASVPDENTEVLSKLNKSVKQTLHECKENLTDPLSKLNNNNTKNYTKNKTKNEREGTLSHSHDFDEDIKDNLNTEPLGYKGQIIELEPQEINIGSGRCRMAKFKLLALTLPEAMQVEEMLKDLNPVAINRILLHASSMAESSESRKAASRSFSYIASAVNDYKKAEAIGKPKPQGPSERVILPQHRIVKASRRDKRTEEQIKFVKELVAKMGA